MPDTLTQEQRRRCMSHIRSKNTRPEILVRHELFRRGYRYRIIQGKLKQLIYSNLQTNKQM